ncbi:MAG: GNAT family N-acetyltransferase [Candidatus Thiodiazotropha sp.]
MDHRVYQEIIEPRIDDLAPINEGLHAFGLQQTRGEKPRRVAIVCRSPQGSVIGGIIGHSLGPRFYLTQLWVEEARRGEGIGSTLVRYLETYAENRTCSDILVDTLNPQAVSFYQRLGYQVYLVNPNYVNSFDWYFLSKKIVQAHTTL